MGAAVDENENNSRVENSPEEPDPPSTTPENIDEEGQLEKIPYPKSVFFIVLNELCERFSFYGMRTILSLYLRDKLLFTESDSTILYHAFTVFVYTFPLLGAIISDSWLGKFKTILYLSVVYSCGNILLAVASAKSIGLPQVPFSLLALFIIALGTGGIKPCVSSFGGDQFTMPQHAKQVVTFFSIFYFAINFGSFISSFLTPVLREDVQCFGEDTCYPLAFGVPGILMILSIIVFVAGKPMYRMNKPKGNVMVEVCKCMTYALKKKRNSEKKLDHWMDYAEDKYGKKLVSDIKITLKVSVLFVPLPIFWALYDQQGSGWTFQAARMNGDVGFYTILPDQMQVINAVLILAFVPLFTYGVYPLMAKCNLITTPLQKMVVGGFLAAAAFGISVAVAFALEAADPTLPEAGTYQLRIYNPLSEELKVGIAAPDWDIGNYTLEPMGFRFIEKGIKKDNNFTITVNDDVIDDFRLKSGTTHLLSFYREAGGALGTLKFHSMEDDIVKPENGLPNVRTLIGNPDELTSVRYIGKTTVTVQSNKTGLTSFQPGSYKLSEYGMELEMGGVYTILVNSDPTGVIKVKTYETTTPNNIHMLWLIPQYVVLTAAEIMFSVTGLELSYSQAPVSMKSVLSAIFLLTTAGGNLLIVVIEVIKLFDKQSYDFLLYTVLMVLDMIAFAFLAKSYVYVTNEQVEDSSESDHQTDDYNKDS